MRLKMMLMSVPIFAVSMLSAVMSSPTTLPQNNGTAAQQPLPRQYDHNFMPSDRNLMPSTLPQAGTEENGTLDNQNVINTNPTLPSSPTFSTTNSTAPSANPVMTPNYQNTNTIPNNPYTQPSNQQLNVNPDNRQLDQPNESMERVRPNFPTAPINYQNPSTSNNSFQSNRQNQNSGK